MARRWSDLADHPIQLSVGKQCNYPDGSLPQCSSADPCGFTCTNGFTSSGDKCECTAPKRACNGVCSNTASCPSSTPEKKRAENLRQKRMSCDVGFTACGTTSSYRKTLGPYECVDTETDLESCKSGRYPPARYASDFPAHSQAEAVTSPFTKALRKAGIVLLL